MKEILTIFKYVDGENDELFYSSAEPIKLYEYSFSSTRMGSSTISSTLLFPVCLDNLWSGKEYVLFRGTRYFIKNTPSSTKDNTSALYTHSLEFAPETELQLSNVYFIDAVYSGSDVNDKIKTNSTKVIFFGTLAEFAARIEKAISYSGLSGYSVTIDEGVSTDTQQVSFEDKTIFEALQDSFEIYGVPFYFIGKAIHFGHTDNDISQPFKYGVNNELLSIKKNNANYKIVTRITGKGGERNIPYYYPNNSPKGNIKAQALSSNTAITQADINLVNAEKFSNKVDLGASVVYYHGTESVQSWTVNGVPDSGGLHSVTIPTYGPVVEKYVFQLSILSAGIFKISFDMWIQYVGTVYPIGDLISRYVLKNKDTGDSLSLTPIDSDKSTEYFLTPWLAEGDYELEIDFTLRFQGHQEYTYSLTPNIDSDYGWAVIATDGSGKVVELNDIGVEITKAPSVGDGFTQVSLGSMPASTVLLPPIYRETSGEERFYDAENNTYVIPGTEDYYQFENQFSDSYPKEHIFSDDSIYPTINGITNASGQEIGRFLQVAFDENDNDETATSDDGSTENYVHPYFFVKLPKFDGSWGFNLFDHAIESGEMEIVMTSGNCNGCHFVIGVDESSQKNLVQVDASGNLLRDEDGDVRCGRDGKPGETPQDRQNDTRTNEVWIALKKDISTFGVIMPNATNNYRPLAADKFVIINILLPQAYIEKAENELKEASIKYMAENNSEKFNFSVSFSRIYLATHPEIAGLIDENARLRITYNGATYPFYVSQFTYKAIADESLPEIGVELSEAITVNKGILQNTVDEIKGDISKINTSIDPARSMRSYFLLKNQNDETSGIVRFISGILLGSASSSNSFGFNINNLGGVDGILSNLTLYGGSQNGNAALNLVNGVVAGLRHTVKRITGDATLTSDDYIVLASSESAATITLPEIPQNGQMYRIYSTSAAGITIYGNGRPIYRTGSTVALTQSVISASSGLVDIFYSFSGGGWYLSAPDTELFELVNIGTEENPLMAIRAKYGLFSDSFISARGSDPEAGSGGSGGGLDVQAMWYALGQPTNEKINVSHIPELTISKITGLQGELDSKLSGITGEMVTGALGYTPYDASRISTASVAYAASAGKVENALTINNDGGSSSASAKTYNGSSAVTINIPTTLPASDVYSWAKQPVKPSYTFSEIGSKPSTLSGYGITDGVNAAEATGHLTVSVSGHKLTIGVASGYTIPTASQITLWDKVGGLFDVDEDGNVYVKDNRGFYGNSFISARGSDAEAGQGGGTGVNMESVWYALGQPTNEKINVSHIPELTISKITGLQDALDSKLEGITKGMVEAVLTGTVTSHNHDGRYAPLSGGLVPSQYLPSYVDDVLEYASMTAFPATGEAGKIYVALDTNLTYRWGGNGYVEISPSLALGHTSSTAYPGDEGAANASAIKTLQGYFSGGAAKRVAHALTVKHDGGSSSASAKTYNGSAAVTVTIPTTLPASDVYAWAKAATKPSYTWGEIGGKPSAFTPAEHTHVKADITDFPTSWAWSAITGKPSTLAGYGITDGVNSVTASGGLSASVSGHKLTVGVASGYAVPTSAQISAWNLVASLFGVDSDGNVYVKDGKGFYGQSFVSSRGSDPGAGSGGGSGVDMESVWYAMAQPTTEKINVSHIPLLQQLSGALTNAQLANSAITVAGVRVSLGGAVTTAQIASALTGSGYKLTDNDTTYTLTKSGSTITLTGSDGRKTSVTDSNTTYTLGSFGITATAAEINKLDGLATTAAELGYVHGVTSPIQEQLNSKANTSALSAYLPLAGGAMSGNINLLGANSSTLRVQMNNDNANYRRGIAWESVNHTLIAEIGYKNFGQLIYLNPISNEITDVWSDAVGKYSLVISKDLLTYNTYPLLHSGNYTSYTVTKTGGGASGTWPISISGNAASANNAAYLRSTYTGSGGLQPPSYFNGMGLKVNMMNKPVSYCDVIVVNGYNGSGSDVPYVNALAFQKTANAHGEVYHARGDYGGSSWGTWYKFLDSYNYTSYTLNRDAIVSTIGVSGTDLVGWTYNGVARSRVTQAQLRTMLGLGSNAYTSTAYLPLASYTASDVLAKLKTVDGSGSGLDADLLDGTQKSGLLTSVASTAATNLSVTVGGTVKSVADLYATYLDGHPATSFDLSTNLGACQDYGVYVIGLMQITDYTSKGNMANGTLIFIRQNGNNPAQKIIYSLSTRYNTDNVRFGYLTLSTHIYVQPCTFTYNGKKWAGFQVSAASSYSTGVVCVRDGLRIGESSTPFLLKYAVSNTGAVINSEVNSSVVVNGADIIESGVHSNAFFGNASSATKLATARSIWGQTFDGTQGVDGHLYLGSPTYRLYFGTSGVTSYLTGEDSGYFSIKSANNTSVAATLLRINLSNGVVSGSGISLSSHLAVSGAEGRGITYTGNHIRLKAATGGWAIGIEPYHNDDTTSFSHSVGGAFGGNANTINYTYYGGTYNSPAMVILPNKMVGIGRTDPWYTLDVNGTIRAAVGIWSNGYVSAKGQDTTSDARYKRDVAALPAQAALAVLMRLRPSTWAWKDDGRRGAGFVAQEVMGVLPEAVREVGNGEDRHLALNYQMLHAYEVCLLQAHESELERLRGRVLLLENEIKRIQHGS